MKPFLLFSLSLLFFLTSSCKKEESANPMDFLFNEQGWYAVEYSRTPIGSQADFKSDSPYIILGQYGSGIKLDANGECHVHYSDGTEPIEEGTITLDWEWVEEDILSFKAPFSEPIEATILELTPSFLWIKYEQVDDRWDYKLRRIE